MPEGHTLHRLARQHTDRFGRRQVKVSSPQGRFQGAAVVDGQRFEFAEAYGKHLFHHFADERVVHVHLGLFGRFLDHAGPPPPPRQTTRYRLGTAEHTTDLVGPTACEVLVPEELSTLIARLGPDPLRADADPDLAFAALQRRRIGIGQALLDQRVLAGVGNVYRAEVLFVHGIHPERPARDLSRAVFDQLWDTLVAWLARGVSEGRIVTVEPEEVGLPRSRMRREDAHYVYRRSTCRRCGSPIRRFDLAGRWAYVCESCQPPPPRPNPS